MDSETNRIAQIGNVCVQWSNLEYALANAIWMMIGVTQEPGKILTASLDAKNRAKMLYSLAHVYNVPVSYRNAIKRVVSALQDDLMNRRNIAVHGIHFPSQEPNSVGIEMHRGKGGRNQRTIPNSEFEALGNDIVKVRDDFTRAYVAYVKKRYPAMIGKSVGLRDLESILRNNSETKADADEKGPS